MAGQSAAFIIYSYMSRAMGRIDRARARLAELKQKVADEALRQEFDLLDLRLRAYRCLCQNAIDAPGYQEKMDYAREKGLKPDHHPRFSLDTSLFRRDILEVVRTEMDNTALLIEVLESAKVPLIWMVSDPAKENTFEFGPNLVDQLRFKLKIMRAHWLDYDRIFTRPNL